MNGRPRTPARERIIDAATTLFYTRGINNVGVEDIIAEAGVARMSLYNHFGSKDQLVVEYLRREEERWWRSLGQVRAVTPAEKLLAVFDLLESQASEAGYRGSPFVNAAVEIADARHPVHRICRQHWLDVREYLRNIAQEAGVPEPQALSHQLSLLLEGAAVAAAMEGTLAPARLGRSAAEVLVRTFGSDT